MLHVQQMPLMLIMKLPLEYRERQKNAPWTVCRITHGLNIFQRAFWKLPMRRVKSWHQAKGARAAQIQIAPKEEVTEAQLASCSDNLKKKIALWGII
jgi:hypothetical protein